MGISCGGLVVARGGWAVLIASDQRRRSAVAVAVALGGILATVALAGRLVSLAVTVQGVVAVAVAGLSRLMVVVVVVE